MDERSVSSDGSELELVFIAKKLKEALGAEELLEGAGIEYHVEPDTYRGGFLFVTERIGAFFYVSPADAERARSALTTAGFKAPGV